MVSLREKRFGNVSNNNVSSDDFDEDSDYEENEISRSQSLQNRGKHIPSSQMNKRFQRESTSKRRLQSARFDHSDEYAEYDIVQESFSKRMKVNDGCNNSGKRQKCFSKNALMARENRIKKKMYVQNLEQTVEKYKDENKKLSSILDNQSTVIADLRKEVKYLKNVVANSTDISKLLSCINQNTGLPVTTSINKNVTTKQVNQSTQKTVDSAMKNKSSHPWADTKNFLGDIASDSSLINEG